MDVPETVKPMKTQHRIMQLFTVLVGFFVANALIAEFIGIKIFSLEQSLGFKDFTWSLLGQSGSLQFTAGVLLWPIVFILTDVINDYFGTRGVRFATFLTAGIIAYGFLMVYVAIQLSPASWWPATGVTSGVEDLQVAFAAVFGQGLWVIGGSLVAFLIGQFVDAFIFQRIKRRTGDRMIWLRATASTIIGQLLDSYVVLYIAFVLGPPAWKYDLFIAVGSVNFVYKLLIAILMIPVLYAVHAGIESWLGKDSARALRNEALTEN